MIIICPEMRKILKKIEIVCDWYEEHTGGEYAVSNQAAYELIEKLEAERK